jgi:hypothetical protein
MKPEKKPDIETVLAMLISDGIRDIEVECDHGEWWVNVVAGNIAVGIMRYADAQEKQHVVVAIDRLRKEKSISVNDRAYRVSFKYRENFTEPCWTLRVSEPKDQKSKKSAVRRRGKPRA